MSALATPLANGGVHPTPANSFEFSQILSHEPAPETSAMPKKQLFAVLLALSAAFPAANARADLIGTTAASEQGEP